MAYESEDYPSYPGSNKEALKVDFSALVESASKLAMEVTFETGRTCFDPVRRLINIDTKTQNKKGFVSIGILTDEYLHAWNQVKGRGKYLVGEAAVTHKRLGRTAERYGTGSGAFVTSENIVFHKLEALNFVASDAHVPCFIWRIRYIELRQFAFSWQQHF